MSELLQSGLHPDAEVLNAFVEGVLPAHERAQALTHLAECADCRKIVFLALPPAAAEAPAESLWQRWFRSSPLLGIGIGAAVLACALIVSLTLRTHPASAPPTQTASEHPPVLTSPPQFDQVRPTVIPRSTPQRMHPPIVRTPEPSPQLKPIPQPPTLDGTGRSWITARGERGLVRGANSGVGIGSGSGTGVAGAVMPATPSAAPPVGAADAAPQSATETFAVESQSQALHAESAQMASAEPLQAMAKMRSVEPALQPLPSNLPSVAAVSSGKRTLAADSAGELFLSQDTGQHWKRVAMQWKGKVTQLQLADSISTGGALSIVHGGAPEQGLAEVKGTVVDSTGTVIAGAIVEARAYTEKVTAAEKRTIVTNRTGGYDLAALPPGGYRITISAPGFKTSQHDLTLQPQDIALLSPTLQVGAVAETVAVQGAYADTTDEIGAIKAKRPQSPPLFRLTTDSGAVWLSSDGLHWQPAP